MTELEFLCDACGRPVEDGHGSLYVLFSELHKRRNAMSAWKAASEPGTPRPAVSLVEALQLPSPAPWHIHHDRCRPRHEGDGYHIDVERIRSWRDLVRWTAHLMEKNWLGDTNWQVLLGNAADGRDQRIVELARGDAA